MLSKLNYLSFLAMKEIKSSTADNIGDSVLSPILKGAKIVGMVAAVIGLIGIAIIIMITKKQEERSDAMTRVFWIFIGLAIIGLATSIVGFAATQFKLA